MSVRSPGDKQRGHSSLKNDRGQRLSRCLPAGWARYAVPLSMECATSSPPAALMSYGTDLVDMYGQSGIYARKIVKGARPADLPIQQVT